MGYGICSLWFYFFNIYGQFINRIPFWDSLFNNTQQCINIRLANILSSIKEVLNSFVFFSRRHVYRDKNKEVDKASKEGLQISPGLWKIRERQEGNMQEY